MGWNCLFLLVASAHSLFFWESDWFADTFLLTKREGVPKMGTKPRANIRL